MVSWSPLSTWLLQIQETKLWTFWFIDGECRKMGRKTKVALPTCYHLTFLLALFPIFSVFEVVHTSYSLVNFLLSQSITVADRSPPKKHTKVTLSPLFCSIRKTAFEIYGHCVVHRFCAVKYKSSLLQKRSGYETWLPNVIEIAPLKLLAGSAPGRSCCSLRIISVGGPHIPYLDWIRSYRGWLSIKTSSEGPAFKYSLGLST